MIVALAGVMAVPIGVLIAIYMTEFAGAKSRIANALRLGLDLMQGVPSIVIGIFVLGLIVEPLHKDSGFAGSVALAIIMVPLVARSTQEVLRLVPSPMREASDALGVDRWRSILTVILPAALGGIITGSILAVARAAGETAPLLVARLHLRAPPHLQLVRTDAEHPGVDPDRIRLAQPDWLPPGVGGGAGAAGAYPVGQHRGTGCCSPEAAANSPDDRRGP